MDFSPVYASAGQSLLSDVPGPSPGILEHLRANFGGWPGKDDAPGTPAAADLTDEKPASGPRNVVLPRFLPYFDEVTGETPQIRAAYRKMLADPNCKAALYGTVFGVASLDLQIHPATKTRKRDQKVADFVQWNLTRRIGEGLAGLIESVLVAMLVDGYSVNLKVWGRQDTGKYEGNYVLRKIKCQDTGKTMVPQTDEHLDIVGFQGLQYNAGEVFPPSDFLIARNMPLYNSPTGTSTFRAAYSRYWALDTATKLRAMAVERAATGVPVGKYPNASLKPALEAALASLRSRGWLAIPADAEVTILNLAEGSDAIFKSATDDWREEIFLAIQGATLQALTGGQGEQRGSSKVHKSTADLFRWRLSATVECLLNDEEQGLIKDMVDLNYVVSEYPWATLSAVDPQELASEMTVDEGLTRIGLPLSREETYARYSRSPPKDGEGGEDTLKAPAGGGAPGGKPPGTSDGDDPLAGLLGGGKEDGDREISSPELNSRADEDEPEDFAEKPEHKGKGKGGGQFVSKGKGGDSEPAVKEKAPRKEGEKPNNKVDGKAPPEEAPTAKALRAKASAVRVDASVQRYAEEHNEPRFARVVGGKSHPDSEPMDVTTRDGDLVEIKTMVLGTDDKLTMNSYAQVRKALAEKESGKPFHTVVSDDREIYNAGGEGQHGDDSARVYYYRRGIAGSARIGTMHRCKDEAELLALMKAPEEALPPGAGRTDQHITGGDWEHFKDDLGKGYKDRKTGKVFRAKK